MGSYGVGLPESDLIGEAISHVPEIGARVGPGTGLSSLVRGEHGDDADSVGYCSFHVNPRSSMATWGPSPCWNLFSSLLPPDGRNTMRHERRYVVVLERHMNHA
ncbi:LOW QUALITY PROTEIN: hypothetical protein PanWU01x14_086440 [Parasponia andersonii]|uniref:Uncharacterized protein n=1 Tax=Parasponia andersonii TaxID=3476 RepID=A0A2P5D983_PARAD|nr:LOW QUALITY PROTEIN: hypothetical protein PanWU01x14_086440 [Parasponia andersonii]